MSVHASLRSAVMISCHPVWLTDGQMDRWLLTGYTIMVIISDKQEAIHT